MKEDGTVWSWGDNTEGQLGNGTSTRSNTPVQVSNLNSVIAIAAGGYHCLALKDDGTTWAWGWNSRGQFGDGTTNDSNVPVLSSPLSFINVIAIAAGAEHTLVLRSNGQVLACGRNGDGQLGNGTNINSSSPTQVGIVATNIAAIAAGDNHSLALTFDGIVYSWGDNFRGQLGNGDNISQPSPVQVNALTDIATISGGQSHSLVRKNDGTVLAFGGNSNGELGNGNTTDSNLPVPVSNLSQVTRAFAAQNHSIALSSDGTVRTWGVNVGGQLGNGLFTNSDTPVHVVNLCSVFTSISEVPEETIVSVFPNPSSGMITVTIPGANNPVQVKIYSMLGGIVNPAISSNSPSSLEIDLTGLSDGIYVLKINVDGAVYTEKILKR